MKIMQNSMERQFRLYKEELEEKALAVLRSGWYVLGPEVEAFESEFAEYIGMPYCVGLASGLDALSLAFRALGIGQDDEVIVAANAYIACVMGITINHSVPVFVDANQQFNLDPELIESKITSKTKAILAVHLFGQACDMDSICTLAKKYDLAVVEDCAQSHGAYFNGKMTGTFGDIACFSFYPTKNLGAFGDAGAIVTSDLSLEEKIRVYRNYGSEKRYYNQVVGVNSRLDELQAGLLRVKLSHLGELTDQRRDICSRYLNGIRNPAILLPLVSENSVPVWHQFVIRCKNRDALIPYLSQKGVHSVIHYPIPPYLSEAYAYLRYKKGSFPITEQQADEVLSIPLFNGMSDEEIDYVIDTLNCFQSEGNL